MYRRTSERDQDRVIERVTDRVIERQPKSYKEAGRVHDRGGEVGGRKDTDEEGEGETE